MFFSHRSNALVGLALLAAQGASAATNGTSGKGSSYFSYGQHKPRGCGATLIHSDMLMTSAQCQDVFFNGESIHVGAKNGFVKFDAKKAMKVKATMTHPDYDNVTLANDIMLVQLQNATKAKPIDFFGITKNPKSTEKATIIGLGKIAGNKTSKHALRKAEVDILGFARCSNADHFKNSDIATMEANQICAGILNMKKQKPCSGDIGGPLLTSKGEQIGIISSYGCGAGHPSLYTRVSAYKSWVQESVCQMSMAPPSDCGTMDSSATSMPSMTAAPTPKTAGRADPDVVVVVPPPKGTTPMPSMSPTTLGARSAPTNPGLPPPVVTSPVPTPQMTTSAPSTTTAMPTPQMTTSMPTTTTTAMPTMSSSDNDEAPVAASGAMSVSDCGCPNSCNDEILDRMADTFTCRARIDWVINESGLGFDEEQACVVLNNQFPTICTCDPRTCNARSGGAAAATTTTSPAPSMSSSPSMMPSMSPAPTITAGPTINADERMTTEMTAMIEAQQESGQLDVNADGEDVVDVNVDDGEDSEDESSSSFASLSTAALVVLGSLMALVL